MVNKIKLAWFCLSRSNKKKKDEILHCNEIKTTPSDTKPVERNLSIPACKLLFCYYFLKHLLHCSVIILHICALYI